MASTTNKLSTPALLPWIPPGKPKESSSNVLVNKKNSGGYDYGSSIASSTMFKQPKKKNVSLTNKFWSPKKNSRKLTLGAEKERRIESLLKSSVNSQGEQELLRAKIMGIFDEAEEKHATQGDKDKQNRKRRNSEPEITSKHQSDWNNRDNTKSPGYNEKDGKEASENSTDNKQRRPSTYNKNHRERSRAQSRSRRNQSNDDENKGGHRNQRERSRSHSKNHKSNEDDINQSHHNQQYRNLNSSANKDTRGVHKHTSDNKV